MQNDVKFDDNDGKKRTLLFDVLSLQSWCIIFFVVFEQCSEGGNMAGTKILSYVGCCLILTGKSSDQQTSLNKYAMFRRADVTIWIRGLNVAAVRSVQAILRGN